MAKKRNFFQENFYNPTPKDQAVPQQDMQVNKQPITSNNTPPPLASEPAPQPIHTSTTFNPDKTVTINIGQNSQTLNQKQYEEYLKRSMGNQPPQVGGDQINQLQREKNAAQTVNTSLQNVQKTADVNSLISAQEQKKLQEQNQPQIATSINQLPQAQNPQDLTASQKLTTGFAAGEFVNAATSPQPVKDILSTTTQALSRLPFVGKYVAARSGAASTAIATFGDLSATIDKQIAAVQTGTASAADVQKSIELALAATNRLEAEQKGLGKTNLNYWIDQGKDIEAEVMRQKQTLNMQLAALQLAQAQGARARYGL